MIVTYLTLLHIITPAIRGAFSYVVTPSSLAHLHRIPNRRRPQFLANSGGGSYASSSPVSSGDSTPPVHSLESIASGLSSGSFRDVLVVVGAGASVSAGIPDFRTPGTGLYDRLSHYNLPRPEDIFDIHYYRGNPRPFVEFCGETWPGRDGGPAPTPSHRFMGLLGDAGVLRRVYTQNIDGLESLAGVGPDALVECHGGFGSASCATCQEDADVGACREAMVVRKEVPTCAQCGGPVKPGIVFFGEKLPARFGKLVKADVHACDLLIVIGTSLAVDPVASIPKWVSLTCPRLLLNRDLVGDFRVEATGRKMGSITTERDVFYEGDCDDGVRKICDLAGWSGMDFVPPHEDRII